MVSNIRNILAFACGFGIAFGAGVMLHAVVVTFLVHSGNSLMLGLFDAAEGISKIFCGQVLACLCALKPSKELERIE
jgi:hypothetical protein